MRGGDVAKSDGSTTNASYARAEEESRKVREIVRDQNETNSLLHPFLDTKKDQGMEEWHQDGPKCENVMNLQERRSAGERESAQMTIQTNSWATRRKK